MKDKNGILEVALNENQPYINTSSKNLPQSKSPYVSDIYFDQLNGQYVFHISIPVKSLQKSTIGYFQRVYSAKEFLPKFFDLFFTTKPQGEGTRVGFKIVHKIIQKYGGGEIDADSVLGMGTEFKISFSLEKTEKGKKSEVLT